MKLKVKKQPAKKCTCGGNCQCQQAQPIPLVTSINQGPFTNDVQGPMLDANRAFQDYLIQSGKEYDTEITVNKLFETFANTQANLTNIFINTILPQIDARAFFLTEELDRELAVFLKQNSPDYNKYLELCKNGDRRFDEPIKIFEIDSFRYDSLSSLFYQVLAHEGVERSHIPLSSSALQYRKLLLGIEDIVCNTTISCDKEYAKSNIPMRVIQLATLHVSILYSKILESFTDRLIMIANAGDYYRYNVTRAVTDMTVDELAGIYNTGKAFIDTYMAERMMNALVQSYTEIFAIAFGYHQTGQAQDVMKLIENLDEDDEEGIIVEDF